MVTDGLYLPPDYRALAAEFARQPASVQELFRFAVTLMLIDEERAWIVGTRTECGRERLKVRTITHQSYEIVRPEITEEQEARLMAHVRALCE